MRLIRQIVTCPGCDASFSGAINRADKLDQDAICPRCRNRFSVVGFFGRLSEVLRPKAPVAQPAHRWRSHR